MLETEFEFIEEYLRSPSSVEKEMGIWLLKAGHNIGKKNYKWGPYVRNHYCIHLIKEGELCFRQSNIEIRLKQGDVFCLIPDLKHDYWSSDPNTNLRMIWVSISGPQAKQLLNILGVSEQKPYIKDAMSSDLLKTFTELTNSIIYTENGLRIISKIYELLYWLNQKDQKQVSEGWIAKGKEYMELHFNEGITVADVANYVNIERTHFSKKFSKTMGESPFIYLQRLRLSKSKELLKHTSLTITEVAYSVGFQNLFSFSKFFKKSYGISPREFKMKTSHSRD